jgi:hypothetical protein
MALIGMVIAMYNYMLQKTDWFETIGTCSADNPCSAIDMEYLGFITIPLLSFVAFWSILIICIAYYAVTRKNK